MKESQNLSFLQIAMGLAFGVGIVVVLASNGGFSGLLSKLQSPKSEYVESCTNHYSKMGESLNEIGLSNNESTWSKICECISNLDNGKTAEDFKRNTNGFLMQAHMANFSHCSR